MFNTLYCLIPLFLHNEFRNELFLTLNHVLKSLKKDSKGDLMKIHTFLQPLIHKAVSSHSECRLCHCLDDIPALLEIEKLLFTLLNFRHIPPPLNILFLCWLSLPFQAELIKWFSSEAHKDCYNVKSRKIGAIFLENSSFELWIIATKCVILNNIKVLLLLIAEYNVPIHQAIPFHVRSQPNYAGSQPAAQYCLHILIHAINEDTTTIAFTFMHKYTNLPG